MTLYCIVTKTFRTLDPHPPSVLKLGLSPKKRFINEGIPKKFFPVFIRCFEILWTYLFKAFSEVLKSIACRADVVGGAGHNRYADPGCFIRLS